jgi:hypothetical protein
MPDWLGSLAGEISTYFGLALRLLQENWQTIHTAVQLGGAVTGAFLLRSLFRQYRLEKKLKYLGAGLPTKIEGSGGEKAEAKGKPAYGWPLGIPMDMRRQSLEPADYAQMMVQFDTLKALLVSESRKSAIMGFGQNVFFFLLGTASSILIPKFFP